MGDELKDDRLETKNELDMPGLESSVLMTTPDHLKPAFAKSFRPAACHPDRPIYGTGPWCRRCKDLIRWQGERGRAKVLADVEANYAGSEELKAEFVSAAKRTHVRALTLTRLTERWRLVESTRERLCSRPAPTFGGFLALPVSQLLMPRGDQTTYKAPQT